MARRWKTRNPLLADDHTLVREGLRIVLEANSPTSKVVAEAGDGVEAVADRARAGTSTSPCSTSRCRR